MASLYKRLYLIVLQISTAVKTIMTCFLVAASTQTQAIADFRFTPAATGWAGDLVDVKITSTQWKKIEDKFYRPI